ncbi:DF family (seleno)protein [Thermoanaerobacterium thermosaccharolyticum]|uniref:DF family (seleno)protein n=1 Tax=Thermoanaerobacterium thermosaccharolyticum TaxID=1517 RepID=UPI0017807154|nr:thioredoxin family protein [Thermoanaerobacterium thermosaccharolyticum]MBE0068514.1 thioredoxin family protein [Thermoanaerobacterium thermosaccharolyticum]MBE0228529.1 thioredoxin family protein [Thermoanaerobacterium thermosaccharolyticum]
MQISFLYFEGCPNSEPALNLLKEVLNEKGIKGEIELIKIESQEDAYRYKFLGSPSIHINGKDIEKERRNDEPLYGCRVYKTIDGYSGIPSREMILYAVNEALIQ